MVKLQSITVDMYRKNHSMFKLLYAFHSTPFGKCLIAVTKVDKAVVYLGFVDGTEAHALKDLKSEWPLSEISEDNKNETISIIEEVFQSDTSSLDSVSVFLKGTEFQIKVWEALLTIPKGDCTTYEEVAKIITNQKAVRAIGTAISKNRIAYIIPCHRVRGKNGSNEYAWGVERKEAILKYEQEED